MEYLANYNNLHNVLDNVKLSRCDCIKFAIDICKGLSYCHIKSVYHMDLKPKNILISADGICKLCDFGNSYRDGWSVDYVHQVILALFNKVNILHTILSEFVVFKMFCCHSLREPLRIQRLKY